MHGCVERQICVRGDIGKGVGHQLGEFDPQSEDGSLYDLSVSVVSIELLSMSTLPLYREKIFCQIDVTVHHGNSVSSKQMCRKTRLYSSDMDLAR